MAKRKYFFLSYLISLIIYVIALGLLYLYDNYVGFTMNIILTGMVLSILAISFIAELIDKSRVSREYFWILSGCVTAGILCFLLLKYDFS